MMFESKPQALSAARTSAYRIFLESGGAYFDAFAQGDNAVKPCVQKRAQDCLQKTRLQASIGMRSL
jgi:hypothetical protein